jgi:hypothetical protein
VVFRRKVALRGSISEDQKVEDQNLEARDGIEPPVRALQALPLASLGTAPQYTRPNPDSQNLSLVLASCLGEKYKGDRFFDPLRAFYTCIRWLLHYFRSLCKIS